MKHILPKYQSDVTPGPYRVRESGDGYEVVGANDVRIALFEPDSVYRYPRGSPVITRSLTADREVRANAEVLLTALRARAKEKGR